jgi:mannose-6-phosphate isomerase-like protein (cupin superfamily)
MKTTTPTHAEMAAGLGRFANIQSTEDLYRKALPKAVADAVLPIAMPQKLYVTVGPNSEVGADPACGRGPEGFVAMVAECEPHVGPPLHAHHLTHEIFFVAKGRFRVEWGDEGEHSIELDEFDTLCVPPGCNRRFVNISEERGYMFAIAYGHKLVLQDTAGPPSVRAQILASAPEIIEGAPTAEWLDRMGLRYDAGLEGGQL